MNVRTICLALLHFGETTGYEIRKLSVEGPFSHFLDASYGSIYPALSKLEKDGCVTFREETQPGKPARKVYAITDLGREELVRSLSVEPGPDVFRSEFLLIAKLAPLLDPAFIDRVLKNRIAKERAEIEHLKGIEDECLQAGAAWTVAYGLAVQEASLNYLETHAGELVKLAGTHVSPQTEPAQ